MKRFFLIATLAFLSVAANAQVTLLKANKSLEMSYIRLNGKALLVSDIDKSLWVTDGTPAGTIQLSTTIAAGDGGTVMNGKFYFPGTTAATGEELFVTDGTVAGTHIVKDIFGGTTGSAPDEDFAVLNGWLYFTAANAANGRELWRTDGTEGNTKIVKDIIAGTAGSNDAGDYNLFSTGSYLLFSAKTANGKGVELYKSDGTDAGTSMLADINPGAGSSNAGAFYAFNNAILFTATTANEGTEMWRTDGTVAGTKILKDIRTGPANALTFTFMYPFNGKLLFNADNGSNGNELWITDGTTANTHILKDINPGTGGSSASLISAVKFGNKLIFTASNSATNSELWITDGTDGGTTIFKDIVSGPMGSFPFILPAFDIQDGSWNTPLFQGNKFFLMVRTADKGYELWISDGTSAGTKMVKDINPDAEDGMTSPSYIYTSNAFYFTANNGVKGNELWKSDGTLAGTTMVADINPDTDPTNSDSDIQFAGIINNKIVFMANNGDASETDLYRLDGTFTPLPVTMGDFTVTSRKSDALLQWSTLTEQNTKEFTIQRSFTGENYASIGTVAAAGSSLEKRSYSFIDANVLNSKKAIVYYRILTTDKDGKSTYSKVISMKLKQVNSLGIQLVENPVRSEIKVSVADIGSEHVSVFVKDVAGKTVAQVSKVKGNCMVSIPAANLQPGVYVLVAEGETDKKAIKFVKQ